MKIFVCSWVLIVLGVLSQDFVVASGSGSKAQSSQRRSGSNKRRSKPPNRRLRRGKLFQNGQDPQLQQDEWEDGNAESAINHYTDGVLDRREHETKTDKPVVVDAAKDASRAQQSSDWASWGVQWVGDGTREREQGFVRDAVEDAPEDSGKNGKPGKQDAKKKPKAEDPSTAATAAALDSNDWRAWGTNWVEQPEDRAGDSGLGVVLGGDSLFAEDRKGGGAKKDGRQRGRKRKEKGRTGSSGSNNPKGGGDARQQKGAHNKKAKNKGKNKGKKRRLEGQEHNVFTARASGNNGDATVGESGNADLFEVKQAAKASISRLKDLDFSSNTEWMHTSFLFDDSTTDENGEEPKGKPTGDKKNETEYSEFTRKSDVNQEDKGKNKKEKKDGAPKEVKQNEAGEEVQNNELGRDKVAEEDEDIEKISAVGEHGGTTDDKSSAPSFDQYSYTNLIKNSKTVAPEATTQVPTSTSGDLAPTSGPEEDQPLVVAAEDPTSVPATEVPTPVEDINQTTQTSNPEPENVRVSHTEAGGDEEGFGWEDSTEDGDWVYEPSAQLNAKQLETASPSEAPPSNPPTLFPSEDRIDCKICSHGRAPLYPDRIILHTKQTCEDFAGELDFAPGGTCAAIKADIPIDLEGYCGCEGFAPTGRCTFCSEGTTNLYAAVSIPALNGMTCADVEFYTAFISDKEVCDKMDHLSSLCCGSMQNMWSSRAHEKTEEEETMEWEDNEGDGFADAGESGDGFR